MMTAAPRLDFLASLVPPCDTLCDVGTDHAYLPVMAIRQGRVKKAIAGDIGEGPCEAARKTVHSHHLEDVISVRLGSGLTVIRPGEANTVVIAGMGAGTMVEILDAAPEVLASPALTTLILQPMNDSEKLRHWCERSGWGILREELVQEGERIYEVLIFHKDPSFRYEGLTDLVGNDLVQRRHPLLETFVRRLIAKYDRLLSSMEKSPKARQSKHYQTSVETKKRLEEILHGNDCQ